MGLDIVLYDINQNRMGVFEISEELHSAIFSPLINWSSYLTLRKLKDYYLTNVRFDKREIKQLVVEVNIIAKRIDNQFEREIIYVVDRISNSIVYHIHIAGD
ncbi:hypothetical protein IC620_15180 [Hazenella sp. IB182357]|uniref:Uncharacterized protein n=1 Tax=Polycladospora coralii TaxID=2771432 RepID=A0A926NBS3_9BACL|nr:hypothetical protein [Polycladospora coralii]MBD1373688.1 hypothetical protein [Polycladospora coralii]